MVLTGLTMSPGFNAVCPWLLELFGGRQSARSIHFLCAFSIVLLSSFIWLRSCSQAPSMKCARC